MSHIISYLEKNLIIFILISIHSIFAYSPFSNYTPSIRINNIEIGKTFVWAATKGGLMRTDPSEDETCLKSGITNFPDLNLTTLCYDSSENLWIGTKKGYLYMISPKGHHNIYDSYSYTKWKINSIFHYDKYLIVGAEQGCSLFDIENKKAIQNATSFGNFKSPVVYNINVFKDTLYLACADGIAKLNVAGNNLIKVNFLDKYIWSTVTTDSSVHFLPVINDTILYMHEVAASWNGNLLYAIDNCIYIDTNIVCELPSKVLSIKSGGNRYCWFGTEEHYLYRWDGYNLRQYKTNSITFENIMNIYVANDGTVWCNPTVRPYIGTGTGPENPAIYPWWQGVASFDGKEWSLYNKNTAKNFGKIGPGLKFSGICEGPAGNMWFGIHDRCIKKFNPGKNKWDRYFINRKKDQFYLVTENKPMHWGKCDAIARDSSGYMWFTIYKGKNGCVLCYNTEDETPDKSDYRYFFPDGSYYHIPIPFSLNVDINGNIFIGGVDGKLVVFRYETNPLIEEIIPLALFKVLSKVSDMASSSLGDTWIATGEGLYNYQNSELIGPQLVQVDGSPPGITSIEIEYVNKYSLEENLKIEETVLWVGTQTEGVARISIKKTLNKSTGTIESCKKDSIKYFKEEDGLICNNINSLSVDHKNGFLWIATQEGTSRYDLGHSFKKAVYNKKITAYPNPFVKTRHRRIKFENLSPGSIVTIYSIDGRIIHIAEQAVVKNRNEWTIEWMPDSKIIPGTYFYAAKKKDPSGWKEMKTFVGKILILP